MTDNPIIWQPSEQRREASGMYRFMTGHEAGDYRQLHQWSIEQPTAFWPALAEFCGLEFSKPAVDVLRQPGDMTTARWFPGSELNFAAHLLRREGDEPALISRGENGVRRELSCDELRSAVTGIAAALRDAGVQKGDRVAGFLPNCAEAVIAMLATSSIGAIWSSCSPDFGISGVVDRFGQIEPKVLFCADGYFYNGKRLDSLRPVAGVIEQIDSIERTVVVPFTGETIDLPATGDATLWDDFAIPGAELSFASLPFDHPLYIMYSSGTTGVPKCIVHGAGGTLIQHLKEHQLHTGVGPGDRLFYFTTCGWMMWNWLASGLASGATLILYDGAPFAEDGRILWRIAEEEKMTVFGTSAKYLSALEKAGVRPGEEFDLPSLKTVLSTGSPLAPASFDFVYNAVKGDVQLSSITGGTDIISCFAGGNPMLPVRRGELQCLGLGMAVEIFNDEGEPVTGEAGELVCTQAFPSMPVGFWNDPEKAKYRAAYFERFPGVWAHGDYAEITDSGGMIVHGRSDAVLNPGGVRIGTSEIYRQVEKLDEVLESIAVGQDRDGDVRVVLFVVLRPGITLDEELRAKIRKVIRDNTTPRHVPSRIVAVPDIPRTISGKIVELAVRAVIHGRQVKNTDALANPGALDYFRDRPELAED
ncbi:MAG TPA: acetoacetate--CoA ligase [Woeseiaceae bacterium]|nr:acetoacetate--CoA ligase [Woeseiaceae bacterium]